MRWRLIQLQEHDAFMNMALDESISEAVAGKKAPPTVRFYTWKPSAVSIGYFQSLNDEVDVAACEKQGVDVVRRRTGGGAVYHDTDGEITYSVIAPLNIFGGMGITASYRLICGWIIRSLKLLSITAEFHPVNDILVSRKKVSGNAQTRRNNILLQHGTILYDADIERMFSFLKVKDIKIRDKLIRNVRERVAGLRDFKDMSRQDLYDALVRGFSEGKVIDEGLISEYESARAEELAQAVYCSKGWNFMR